MNIRLFSLFATAGLFFTGCAMEEVPMEGGSIAVVMEDIQTRTAVTDEGAFTWSAGDQIWLEITANPGYVTGTLSSGAGAGRANFAYGTYFGDMTGKAVYPFNAGHDVNGNELSVVLPASYDLGSNLSNTNAAMYGVETNGSIKFNHLAGVMRFKFINAPVGTDKFIITLDKKINGTFAAELTGDYPVLQTETTSNESEKSITLNFDALTSVQDIMLYVPLPLGTYTTLGLEVKAGSQSVWSYSNTVTNTINRKSLLLMPTVNLSGSIGGDIEGGETPSVPDGGDSDYMQYIVYNGTGNNNNTVISGDSSWNLEPFFYSRVSDINEIELKFQMGPSSANPYDSEMRWLFSSERPYVNNGARLSADGLVLRYDNSGYNVVTNEKIITWDEMDASITDKIVLNISVSQKKITVNGREISVPELETFTDIEYLFSSYYYINDDGYAKNYVTVPVESKLYYAKIWNTSGSLLYHGYASEGEKSAGNTQPVWKSEYNGTTYLEFPNTNFQSFWVSTYTSNWLPFGGGIDVDDTPSVSDAVDLSAAGTANSYIVSSAGSYKFSTVKGNSSESVGAVVSAEVLWETFGTSETPSVGYLISNVRYEGGDIFFDTPETFKEGNAVIAAKDASGTILWSWHIWLTDQPEEQVYYNNAGTMMDRNLGATSATPGDVGALGLLYQWGRKDPFLGSSSISSSTEAKSTLTWPSAVSSDSSNGTIDYTIEHPTTFIKRNQNNNDWYDTGSSIDNTRWTTSETFKSVYDPCPVGWRVPDGGSNRSWSKAFGSSSIFPDASLYDSTNKGINFSGIFCDVATIWYPVSGYRNSYDGTLSAVGSNGYCWSASPTPQNFSTYGASLLVFGTGSNVTLDAGSDRSNGFSVRCVKENSSSDLPTEPETPTEPDLSQPSYSVQLNPATYGWVKSTSVSNPDASLYDGVYESTNQGMSNTKSIMYIDINGYDEFTIYVRSYAESYCDYVEVSNLDVNITYRTSGFKMTTSDNQQSGTSISSYTEVKFTNIGGGQHRIMVAYKKDYSYNENDDKGYVLIPKNKGSQTPSEPQAIDYIDEYGINHGQGVEIDGVVWAPVNCGYHATDYKYGKLYQWGRKYGQGYYGELWNVNNYMGKYSDASVPSLFSGPVSLSVGQSSSNSNKFYTSDSSTYDWVTPQNDALWNSGTEDNSIKTEYDPCPEGWRVPTYAELRALKANYSSWTTNDGQNGYWFSGSASYSASVSRVFFPAAGVRDEGGYAGIRGDNGFYWSSRPDSEYAYSLSFYSSDIDMYDLSRRAYGFSVRCVQVTD